MKPLFIALFALFSVSAFGSPITVDQIYGSPGITVYSGNSAVTFGTAADTSQIVTGANIMTVQNKTFDGTSNVFKQASFVYNFGLNGGASTQVINMGLNIPSKSVIARVWMDEITSLGAGSGVPAVSLQVNTSGDLYALTNYTSLTAGETLGVPQTATNAIKLGGSGPYNCTMQILNGTLNAGVFKVFVDYLISQ